ncbi:hypothetical protein C7Y66_02050 [Chroococcidiopsis sp. CCALA 051]|uniref:hypothetical protein n=1 Tax=Chroococcidiopsis sp. CCALA 051 TaxID=869949 RepID=UPI000D0D9F43|nr:hypothetical protein [Chroococcidiopsis sp. CCALA 051]PSM50821.1 hypothetical protein C7Y66_02050 [Chroococcidiopsis sp. CCALA 051]
MALIMKLKIKQSNMEKFSKKVQGKYSNPIYFMNMKQASSLLYKSFRTAIVGKITRKAKDCKQQNHFGFSPPVSSTFFVSALGFSRSLTSH